MARLLLLRPAATAILTAAVIARRGQSLLLAAVAGFLLFWVVLLPTVMAPPPPPGQKRWRHPLELWCGQREEDAVEPEVTVFDAHHHLWDLATQPFLPWGARWLLRALRRLRPAVMNDFLLWLAPASLGNSYGKRVPFFVPYMAEELLEDYKGDGKGHKVTGSVFVESSWEEPAAEKCLEPVGVAAFVTEVHKQHPGICQGIVAHADLRLGAAVEPALKFYASNALVKGIRHSLACARDPAISGYPHCDAETAFDAKFREGFALLAKYGFTYDAWVFHENLLALADLARAFPETTVVCNHIGQPLGIGSYKRREVFEVWKGRMRLLAAEKNVVVKLSGLGMKTCGFGFDERINPPGSDSLSETWRPYIEFVIETFGVDRCMFCSNFPVDKITASFTIVFNAFKKIVSAYSREDKEKLFELNAKRIYRI